MQAINAFSLEFGSVELDAAFDREYRDEALGYYRMLSCAILGFLLIISLTGLVVTFSVNREGIQKLLWFALIPLSATATLALYVPAFARRSRWLMIAFVASLGIVCVVYPRLEANQFIAESYGFSYTGLVIFLALAFGRFSPWQCLVVAGMLIVFYVASSWHDFGSLVVTNHVPLLLGAAALGFAVGYLTERNARGLFAARSEVEDRERRLAASEAQLRAEQARSENLIRSMLPEKIAARLKVEGRAIADGIAECTVLFADIVGFSSLARETGPRALVALLNGLFSAFDELCEAHGLEKIKTIGDSYMAAAGVPEYVEDHPARAADMALAMLDAVRRFNSNHGVTLDLRIGLNSGPVVAGIVGTRKFAYDLWGETVTLQHAWSRTARREESRYRRPLRYC